MYGVDIYTIIVYNTGMKTFNTNLRNAVNKDTNKWLSRALILTSIFMAFAVVYFILPSFLPSVGSFTTQAFEIDGPRIGDPTVSDNDNLSLDGSDETLKTLRTRPVQHPTSPDSDAGDNNGCTNPDPERDLSSVGITITATNSATAEIVNSSPNCSYSVGLASYNVFKDPNIVDFATFVGTQTLYLSDMETVSPGERAILRVSLPTCAYQVDLFSGPSAPTIPNFGLSGYNLFDSELRMTPALCGAPDDNTAPPRRRPVNRPGVPTTPDDGSGCIYIKKETFDTRANPITPVAQFTFTLNGGLNVYNDSNGDAGFTGITPGWNDITENVPFGWEMTSVTPANGHVYVEPNKCATVVFKNKQTTPVAPTPLSVSCRVSPTRAEVGDNVTWSATASGGTSTNYIYSWTGAVTGSGSTKTTSFNSIGVKTATVTVSAGGQTATRTCSMTIEAPEAPAPLVASCSASPSTVLTGQQVTWTASRSGGTGSYTYSWSGAVTGTDRTETNSYSTTGTKTATVVVTSGTESVTRTCSVNVNAQVAALNANCIVSPTSILEGDSATWTTNPSGGTGSYTYSWSGTDGLSGNTRSVTRTYNDSGTKTGTVVVTSGSNSVTRSCELAVEERQTQALSGSCFATPGTGNINDTILWTANASGGTGTFSYLWGGATSGTDRTEDETYTSAGTRNAYVQITSGNDTITRNCSVVIEQPQSQTLDGYCSANPSNVNINETTTWTAYPTGGTGGYTYSWSGDASGTSQNIPRSYSSAGTRYSSVTITSGGQSVTRNCQVNVNTYTSANLSVSCSVNNSNPNINDYVYWNSSIAGGSGNYYYYWSGTDNLSGNSSSISRRYDYAGTKYATINVVSGNESRSATCQVNIGGNYYGGGPNVTVSNLPLASGNPLSFVYLNQIPYTGLLSGGNGLKFSVLLTIWSMLIAFIALKFIDKKRKRIMEQAIVVADIVPANIVADEVQKTNEDKNIPSSVNPVYESIFETVSREKKAIFSEKAKQEILGNLGETEALKAKIENVINDISLVSYREYGWLSVDSESLSKI